jgi:hypothetical protein
LLSYLGNFPFWGYWKILLALFEYFRDLILDMKSISTMEIVDMSLLDGERILLAKATDAKQTKVEPQDDCDATN